MMAFVWVLVHFIAGCIYEAEVVAFTVPVVRAFPWPSSLFFFGACGVRRQIRMITAVEIAPRMVVVFARLVGATTIAFSPFWDHPMVRLILI